MMNYIFTISAAVIYSLARSPIGKLILPICYTKPIIINENLFIMIGRQITLSNQEIPQTITSSNQKIPQTIIDAYGYKAAKILYDALIEGLEEDYEQKLAPLLEPTLLLVYDYILKFSIASSLTFESQIYNIF